VEFGIETTAAYGRTVITLTGELDISAVRDLEAALTAAAAAEHAHVDVDMSGVKFIDSAGLGCLIRAYKRFDEAERRLRIVDPSPTVTRLLNLTGQYERFTVQQ
jgi:anti-sigma B factor antagonist